MSDAVKAEKRGLRDELLRARATLGPTYRSAASATIRTRILSHLEAFVETRIQRAPDTSASASEGHRLIVALYSPIRGEVDVLPLLHAAPNLGWRVVLPKTHNSDRRLSFHEVKSEADLVRGVYGIREPNPEVCAEIGVESLDVLFVPGIGYDKAGVRLGYGGGYYDRLFARSELSAFRVGVAYQAQIVDKLPRLPHDGRVHAIVTEQGWASCEPSQ